MPNPAPFVPGDPTPAGGPGIARAALVLALAVATGEAVALRWGVHLAGGSGPRQGLAAAAIVLVLAVPALYWGFLAPLRRALGNQAQVQETLRTARRDLDAKLAERTAALEAANRSLHQLSARLLTIQEAERARVAQELDMTVGPSLTTVKFMVEEALAGACAAPRNCHLDVLPRIIPVLRRTVEETRRIGTALRPSLLDDLGLTATLRWYARTVQKAFPRLTLDLDIGLDETGLPGSLKTSLFRIVQEALDNAARHGRAERIQAALVRRPGELVLTVRDNGTGFDPAGHRGPGLDAMRQRAELDGGLLRIDSAPGRGTTLTARWPLAAPGPATGSGAGAATGESSRTAPSGCD